MQLRARTHTASLNPTSAEPSPVHCGALCGGLRGGLTRGPRGTLTHGSRGAGGWAGGPRGARTHARRGGRAGGPRGPAGSGDVGRPLCGRRKAEKWAVKT